ncbi:MAG: inositol monophosphatase family protein [Actinomycetes bacterium]
MGNGAPQYSELLELAKAVALEAGTLLMQRPDVFDVTQKTSAVDFATQMDKASETLIVEKLLAARPDDGIIGEEGSSRSSTSGITWVIDPLDGTVNYFYGLPGWNVSIAAKDEQGVVVGVVTAPTINSVWWAVRGGGAFFNGKPIRCNDPVDLGRSLIMTGFSYDLDLRVGQAALVAKLIPKIRDLRRSGGAAVDLCYVGMGSVDGYFEATLNEWDLAAGGLVAREAGAIVTGRLGGPANHEMVVAAGPSLHAQMLLEIG